MNAHRGHHFDERPTRPMRLGYVPLVDCAPILIAREKGFFAEEGLDVDTRVQPGWATIRDKLAYGELEASVCLGPLALAIHHGIGTIPRKMAVPLIISANGNAITLHKDLPREALAQKGALLQFLEESWTKERPFTLACVHRCSSHHSLLLQWLAQEGLSNYPNLEIVFLPPETMNRNLAQGHIDGFCVGEPWNSVAILSGLGWCAATSIDLSNGHPEKVLACSADLAAEEPLALQALTVALLKGCRYCQDIANRQEVISILESEPALRGTGEAMANSLLGHFRPALALPARELPDFHIFFDPGINNPDSRLASWMRKGLTQSGLVDKGQKLPKDAVFRPELFEQALAAMDNPSPLELTEQPTL